MYENLSVKLCIYAKIIIIIFLVGYLFHIFLASINLQKTADLALCLQPLTKKKNLSQEVHRR